MYNKLEKSFPAFGGGFFMKWCHYKHGIVDYPVNILHYPSCNNSVTIFLMSISCMIGQIGVNCAIISQIF